LSGGGRFVSHGAHYPEKHVLDLIGDGNRFSAFAKTALAGEGMSDKIMRKWSESPDRLIDQWTSQAAGLPANCRATSHGGQPVAVE